jgi:hypothetical protein
MKNKTVTVEFQIPDDISDEDFEEWAMFEFGLEPSCRCDNPLIGEYCASDFATSFDIRDW